MPNRLANSTSPYLLQHQENPVDWYPWSDEALALARQMDRPIFLSIGYSACHWCHVMAHESFEDPAIAALINASFVAIKVDREQRPDLDHIYMQAVQMLTGSGGWPMSVFLTPEGRPFYGGTYWPPYAKWGRPGFDQVLQAVADAWQKRREEIEKQGHELSEHIQASFSGQLQPMPDAEESLTLAGLFAATRHLEQNFEASYGGFGDAPKFPHTMDLQLLMRMETREHSPERRHVLEHSLSSMANGGIYDHLGGGFSRYSVDRYWLVPHFEKMLYDNALLIATYVDAYRLTQRPDFLRIALESADYVLRDCRDAAGGFYSAEDADSEGEEGKFYVWSLAEVQQVLGAEAALFEQVYGVTEAGNFEGHSILNIMAAPGQRASRLDQVASGLGITAEALHQQLQGARSKLFAVREKRIRPGLDDKVLVSWNALMIDALAQAACVGDRPDLLKAALRCADFLWSELRQDQRLLHVWRRGHAEIPAFLDDYAYLANAFITLHQATQDLAWLDKAIQLAQDMIRLFADDQQEGFYFVAKDAETLIAKHRDDIDHSIPSGSGMAATALARLGTLTGNMEWTKRAWSTLQASKGLMRRAPGAAGQLWLALDLLLGPCCERLLVVPEGDMLGLDDELLRFHWGHYAPRDSLLIVEANQAIAPANALKGILEGRGMRDGQPSLYVCQGQTCQAPVVGVSSIRESLRS